MLKFLLAALLFLLSLSVCADQFDFCQSAEAYLCDDRRIAESKKTNSSQVTPRDESSLEMAFQRAKQALLKSIDLQTGLTEFDKKSMKEKVSSAEVMMPTEAASRYPTEFKASCGSQGEKQGGFTIRESSRFTVCPRSVISKNPDSLYGVVTAQMVRKIDSSQFPHVYRNLESCLRTQAGSFNAEKSVSDFWISKVLSHLVQTASQMAANFSQSCESKTRARAVISFPAYRTTMKCSLERNTCDLQSPINEKTLIFEEPERGKRAPANTRALQ